MLLYLFYHVLQPYFHALNVFRYITVRTALASLTALLITLVLGPWVIRRLRDLFPRAKLYSMYGLTECKRVSFLPPDQIDRRPESVGAALFFAVLLMLWKMVCCWAAERPCSPP